eukprot:TRINITY_DN43991_c0_g1_i1.p1 TRINITY_DN43991_c0_g1~~TRINITY_DN43991_c0_g1_i1.p1  ORF type:complete len:340 (-),score=58.62 TRINITY_DN43991_c0_g1_i1:192-1211(-)
MQVKLEEANDEADRFKQLLEAATSDLENTQSKLKFVESSVQAIRTALQQAERSNTKLSHDNDKLRNQEPNDCATREDGGDASIFTLYVTYRLWAERTRNSGRSVKTLDAGTQSDVQTTELDVNDGAIKVGKLQLVNKELQKDLSKSNQRIRRVESELATFKDLYLKARDGNNNNHHNQQQQRDSTAEVVVAAVKPRSSSSSPNTLAVPESSDGAETREWMLEQQRNDAVYALEAMEKHRDLLQGEVDRQGLLMQQMFVSQRQGTSSGTTTPHQKHQHLPPPPAVPSTGGLRSFFGGSSVKSAEGEVRVLNARVKSLQSLLESQLKENMELSSQLEASRN